MLVAACGRGVQGSALRGSTSDNDLWSAPVPLGQTLVFGGLVVTAKSKAVSLIRAELIPMREKSSTSSLRIAAAAVGPERGGRVVGTALGVSQLPTMVGSTGAPIRQTTVRPSGGRNDLGTEILFKIRPTTTGMYYFRAVRLTYRVDGKQQVQEFPAYFLLCAERVLRPCDVEKLHAVVASRSK